MYLLEDESANLSTEVIPSGDCNQIDRADLDLIAEVEDRFERLEDIDTGVEGDAWWVPEFWEGETIDVHGASYVVKNVESGCLWWSCGCPMSSSCWTHGAMYR